MLLYGTLFGVGITAQIMIKKLIRRVSFSRCRSIPEPALLPILLRYARLLVLEV
jgi:hypothetical protein